ncbi:hypothetical protein KIPB_000736 [Kipferlia bialata]|uniref:DH domain-containing protein n=1 Tax=Kipferlia bialata TaxID=797122 RepID=A0A9K3CR00_9EUKA|nr:hypothetical protein KIPB_000736 [Kipferlia bialata]|eukprot:g736.t1
MPGVEGCRDSLLGFLVGLSIDPASPVVPAAIGLCTDANGHSLVSHCLRALSAAITHDMRGQGLGAVESDVHTALLSHLAPVYSGDKDMSSVVSGMVGTPVDPERPSEEQEIATRCLVSRVVLPYLQQLQCLLSHNDGKLDLDYILSCWRSWVWHLDTLTPEVDTYLSHCEGMICYSKGGREMAVENCRAALGGLHALAKVPTSASIPLDTALQVAEGVLLQQDLCSEGGTQYNESLYVRRESVHKAYTDFIGQEVAAEGTMPLMVLLGERGMGKTWEAAALTLQTVRDKTLSTVPYYLSLSQPLEETLHSLFGVSSMSELAPLLVSITGSDRRVLFVLDGLQEVETAEKRRKILTWVTQLLEATNGHTLVMVTSTPAVWGQCIEDATLLSATQSLSSPEAGSYTVHLPRLSRDEVSQAMSLYGLPEYLSPSLRSLLGNPAMLELLQERIGSRVMCAPSLSLSCSLSCSNPYSPLLDAPTGEAVLERLGITGAVRLSGLLPLLALLGQDPSGSVSMSSAGVVELSVTPGYSVLLDSGILCITPEPKRCLSVSPCYQSLCQLLLDELGLYPTGEQPVGNDVDGAADDAPVASIDLSTGDLSTVTTTSISTPAYSEAGDMPTHERVLAEILSSELTFNARVCELSTRLSDLLPLLSEAQQEELARYATGLDLVRNVSDIFVSSLQGMKTANKTLATLLVEWTPLISSFKGYVAYYDSCKTFMEQDSVCEALTRVQVRTVGKEEYPSTVGSLLAEPWQRVMRYELLAGEYLKKLPPRHPEIEDMERALHGLKEVAQSVQSTKGHLEGKDGILALCYRLTGGNRDEMVEFLTQPHVSLKQEMQMQVQSSTFGVKVHRNRTLFLLNDHLLVSQVVGRRRSSGAAPKSGESPDLLRITHSLDLNDVELELDGPETSPTKMTLVAPGLSMWTEVAYNVMAWLPVFRQTKDALGGLPDPKLEAALTAALEGYKVDLVTESESVATLLRDERLKSAIVRTPQHWFAWAQNGREDTLRDVADVLKAQASEDVSLVGDRGETGDNTPTSWVAAAFKSLQQSIFSIDSSRPILASVDNVALMLEHCEDILQRTEDVATSLGPIFSPLPVVAEYVKHHHSLLNVVFGSMIDTILENDVPRDVVLSVMEFAHKWDERARLLGVGSVDSDAPYLQEDISSPPQPLAVMLFRLSSAHEAQITLNLTTQWDSIVATLYPRALSGKDSQLTSGDSQPGCHSQIMSVLGPAIAASYSHVAEFYSSIVPGMTIPCPSYSMVPDSDVVSIDQYPWDFYASATYFDLDIDAGTVDIRSWQAHKAVTVLWNDVFALQSSLDDVSLALVEAVCDDHFTETVDKDTVRNLLPNQLFAAYLTAALLRLTGRDGTAKPIWGLGWMKKSHTLRNPDVKARFISDIFRIDTFLKSHVANLGSATDPAFTRRVTKLTQSMLAIPNYAQPNSDVTRLIKVTIEGLFGAEGVSETNARLLLSLRSPKSTKADDAVIESIRSCIHGEAPRRQMDGATSLSFEEMVFCRVQQYSPE